MAGRSCPAGDDGLVRRWDLATGDPVGMPLAGHTGKVQGVDYVNGRALDHLGAEDRTIRIWDANTGAPVHVLKDVRRDDITSGAMEPRRETVRQQAAATALYKCGTWRPASSLATRSPHRTAG